MKDVYDLESIETLKASIFKVFNEIRLFGEMLCKEGLGVDEGSWLKQQEEYYQRIKLAFLLEQETYKKKLHNKVIVQ